MQIKQNSSHDGRVFVYYITLFRRCLPANISASSTWRIFLEILYRGAFKKFCGENYVLLKSDKNVGHFTWSVFQIVVSSMCNATIQITLCYASMVRRSIFITLLIVTFVLHQYKVKALLLLHAKWLRQRTTIFTYIGYIFCFLLSNLFLQLTYLSLKKSSKLRKDLNSTQRRRSGGLCG